MGSSPTRVVITPPWRNWIAHRTSNPGVAGSNPAGGVLFFFFVGGILKIVKMENPGFDPGASTLLTSHSTD